MVFHKATIQNVFYVYTITKRRQCVGFIINTLLGNFAYQHSLYTVVEMHINFVLTHFKSKP